MSSLAPHVPTAEDVVRKMLELAELRNGERLYDLGSGDGRIIIMAA
jgi:cyclopropane fatty-acyl-phospholipid synthase-like methyltransferase